MNTFRVVDLIYIIILWRRIFRTADEACSEVVESFLMIESACFKLLQSSEPCWSLNKVDHLKDLIWLFRVWRLWFWSFRFRTDLLLFNDSSKWLTWFISRLIFFILHTWTTISKPYYSLNTLLSTKPFKDMDKSCSNNLHLFYDDK